MKPSFYGSTRSYSAINLPETRFLTPFQYLIYNPLRRRNGQKLDRVATWINTPYVRCRSVIEDTAEATKLCQNSGASELVPRFASGSSS